MSIETILSQIASQQREIQSLQRQLTSESKDLASKAGRVAQIRQSITKSTSSSMLHSKQRDIQRLENELVKIQEKQAGLNKKIADKTAILHKYEQQLRTEQEKDRKQSLETLKRKEQEASAKQDKLLKQIIAMSQAGEINRGSGLTNISAPKYDAFISHASEDKDDLARPLAETLRKNGLSVWYDEFELKIGDSLRRSIDRGLAHSRFGVVILSPSFFAKN